MVLYTFYLIHCKDPCIVDTYVGRSKSFLKRVRTHHNCVNGGSGGKLYNFIRETGGFSNWDIKVLEEAKYDSLGDAALREMYWYIKNGSKLNTYTPGINYYRRTKSPLHINLYLRRKKLIDDIDELHKSLGNLRESSGLRTAREGLGEFI